VDGSGGDALAGGGGPGAGDVRGASASAAVAGASAPGVAGRGGRRGARSRSGARPLRDARERASHRRTVQRRRDRIVRRLSGCVDGLPRMQRTTLILRYGIGPLRARSGSETARLLDLSRRRVRLLERRGLRRLAGIGRRTSCEGTGIAPTTLVSVYGLLSDTSTAASYVLPAPLTAGVRLAGAASVALADGEGAVAGTRESGEKRKNASSEPEEEGPMSSAGPSIGDPFGSADPALDNPFFLLLVAIVVACLASAAREIRRAVR
jgi:sigma-70-like protein